MSKSIPQINTTDTFQVWLERTNDLIDELDTSILTASVLGSEETIGNATLTGIFTSSSLITDTASATSLKVVTVENETNIIESIDFLSPIDITSSEQKVLRIKSSSQPTRVSILNNANLSWELGSQTSIANSAFILQVEGSANPQFRLLQTGTLELLTTTGTTGTINANVTGNVVGNVTGNITGNVTTNLLTLSGSAVTATASELNKLDGLTASTTELNKLVGYTGNTTDLNYAKDLRATGVTTAEFNKLDGLTASTTELNKLVGYTGNATDLNYAKDLRATGVTAAEFDRLDGLTSSTTELNILDGAVGSLANNVWALGTSTAETIVSPAKIRAAIQAQPLIRGFIAFNGQNGGTFTSQGLSVTKSGTGNYTINILSGFRPANGNYAVVLGNVSEGVTSRATGNLGTQIEAYNSFVTTRSSSFFVIRAIRNINATGYFVNDDNNLTQTFGITVVDPDYITAILLY